MVLEDIKGCGEIPTERVNPREALGLPEARLKNSPSCLRGLGGVGSVEDTFFI